ncbi:phospholipase D-like domain-containing protein [Myxococcota bacterium]|nr:phospholipase D-like domain-containing protein [Myxococcota bacterium]
MIPRSASPLLAPLLLATVSFGSGCVGGAPPKAATEATTSALTLFETTPTGTTLNQEDLPDAHTVWLEQLQSATRSLDLAHFYLVDEPPSRLTPVIDALFDAARRGVAVRLIADEKFYATYPTLVDQLAATPGVSVRRFNGPAHMGGVLHAKYFIVDGAKVVLGSQNFDWRSLEHIHELGVLVESPAVARAFVDVYETDWAICGGDTSFRATPPAEGYGFPATIGQGPRALQVTPVFSAPGWLPDEQLWDEPRLVALIDGARRQVRVQLLNMDLQDREGRRMEALEGALRRAVARGVTVELLLADWSQRPGLIEELQALQRESGVRVHLVTIPQAEQGFIPFARVIHAKYLTVDGRAAWLGTSNWAWGYFHEGRNVGLIVEGEPFAERLDAVFQSLLDSGYAAALDPDTKYPLPRIGE